MNINDLKTAISQLNLDDLNDLTIFIQNTILSTPKTLNLDAYLSNGLICPNCGSIDCVKNGKVRLKQRFICKDCSKTFGLNSNFVTHKSKLSTEQWYKYIECMVNGHSIRKSAEITEVCVKTSFYMRHKILNALDTFTDKNSVSGNVEMDETFLAESFKGNHNKSGFQMPRASRKRGKEVTKRGISSEQICICTAMDKNDNIIMEVVCRGRVTSENLNKMYAGHVTEGSTVCTDSLSSYRKLSKNLNLKHKPIASGKHSNGMFNLARINSLHSRFKTWLRHFNGVSTKFLSNYLTWFKWVESVKGFREESKADKLWGAATVKVVDVRIRRIRGRERVFV